VPFKKKTLIPFHHRPLHSCLHHNVTKETNSGSGTYKT